MGWQWAGNGLVMGSHKGCDLGGTVRNRKGIVRRQMAKYQSGWRGVPMAGLLHLGSRGHDEASKGRLEWRLKWVVGVLVLAGTCRYLGCSQLRPGYYMYEVEERQKSSERRSTTSQGRAGQGRAAASRWRWLLPSMDKTEKTRQNCCGATSHV